MAQHVHRYTLFRLIGQVSTFKTVTTGKCDITFQHSETVDAELDYALLFDEEKSKGKIPQSLQLEKYVIQHGNQKEKSLRIRFPVCGIYKVKVTGSGRHRSLLASFRLECDDVMKDVQPYPVNPKIGFGYNKLAEDVGLTKPSQVKGIMVVRQGKIIKFQFHCKTKLELQTLLVHKDKGAVELASYVTQDRSADDVTVTVTVPEHAQNPEFALQVNARQEGSGGNYDNVLNYLLTHGRDEMDGSGTDRGHRDRSGVSADTLSVTISFQRNCSCSCSRSCFREIVFVLVLWFVRLCLCSIFLFPNLSLPVCVSVCLSVCLCLCLCLSLSVCLSVSLRMCVHVF